MKVYPDDVSTGLKINEMARRTGFTPATLRYYEEIGLMPEPRRTASGYRVYDDASADRLAFIARAKQLGCSLDEIADLIVAWDGGRCGPVQERLQGLVSEKIDAAEQQLRDLVALIADLRRSAAALATHRPTGACDERCGCVSDPADVEPTGQPVALGRKPATPNAALLLASPSAGEVPIACTLDAGALPGRLEDWRVLLASVARREPSAAGVRLVFDSAAPIAEIARLAAAEQDCCRFFGFALTIDGRGTALEITAPAEALDLLTAVFGEA